MKTINDFRTSQLSSASTMRPPVGDQRRMRLSACHSSAADGVLSRCSSRCSRVYRYSRAVSREAVKVPMGAACNSARISASCALLGGRAHGGLLGAAPSQSTGRWSIYTTQCHECTTAEVAGPFLDTPTSVGTPGDADFSPVQARHRMVSEVPRPCTRLNPAGATRIGPHCARRRDRPKARR